MAHNVETAAEQLARWNPAPEDHALERIVGVPTPDGDTRATSHVPMEELNKSFTASDVDAAQVYADDADEADEADGDDEDDAEDDEASYEDLTVDELKDELRERELSVSGNKGELIARLEEDDNA